MTSNLTINRENGLFFLPSTVKAPPPSPPLRPSYKGLLKIVKIKSMLLLFLQGGALDGSCSKRLF